MRTLTNHLLKIATKQLKIKPNDDNSLLPITEIKYLSIVVIMDSLLSRDVTVGVSLEMDNLFKEATVNMLMVQLSSINGVFCEPYKIGHEYDLILTNQTKNEWKGEVYVFSEIGTNYDFQKIKQTIRRIYAKKNNPILNRNLL